MQTTMEGPMRAPRSFTLLTALAIGVVACTQPATRSSTLGTNASALGSSDRWTVHLPLKCAGPMAALGSKIVCLETNWLSDASVSETWEGDGINWVLRMPPVSPPRRSFHAMATLGAKVVMFGGDSNFNPATGNFEGQLDDTWEWDGTSWQERILAMHPSARADALLAAAGNKLVLFGGARGAWLADTWEWDGTGWTEMTPAVSPAGCGGRSCGLAGFGNKAVLYNSGTQETREWNGASWARKDASGPSLGGGFEMAALGGAIVMFGGVSRSATYDQTWLWDGNAWTQTALHDHPPGRYNQSMATLGNVVIMQGGYEGAGWHAYAELWSWTGTAWVELLPDREPPSRDQCAMALAGDRLVLFGGYLIPSPDSNLADTWEWDGAAWTEGAVAPGPPGRRRHAMASFGGNALLFGGRRDATSLLGDTWEWDGNDWVDKAPPVSPSAREGHAMAALGTKIVMFGGRDAFGNALGDTWEWDGTMWTQAFPLMSPSPRYGHLMATGNGKVVLFGDDLGGNGNETWEWDGTNWSNRNPATKISGSIQLESATK